MVAVFGGGSKYFGEESRYVRFVVVGLGARFADERDRFRRT